jgi:UDP-N-acetylglucosamine acyltransferase
VAGHVTINGPSIIGKNNEIFQYSSLGEAPQDKKYKGEPTLLEIGDNNTIREFCTFNRGTVQDKGTTKIGNDNWIMAYVHLAHDCEVGNHTILANNSSLAGHVDIHDYAILGGFTLIHQFCKVGSHVITAVGSVVFKDIPPYVTAAGYDAKPHGINAEGLKRRGFSAEAILQIKRAYKALYRNSLTLEEAKAELATMQKTTPEIALLNDFLAVSTRGIVR